jgi:hypothetical protein
VRYRHRAQSSGSFLWVPGSDAVTEFHYPGDEAEVPEGAYLLLGGTRTGPLSNLYRQGEVSFYVKIITGA